MVNTVYLFSFVETPRKYIIAKLSTRKLGSSSALIILINSTDENPSLRIESFAIINLRGVSTKLNKYISIPIFLGITNENIWKFRRQKKEEERKDFIGGPNDIEDDLIKFSGRL